MQYVIVESFHHDKVAMYEKCRVTGYTGSYMILDTKYGTHEFSREDGGWISGPCMNYLHSAVRMDDIKSMFPEQFDQPAVDPSVQ